MGLASLNSDLLQSTASVSSSWNNSSSLFPTGDTHHLGKETRLNAHTHSGALQATYYRNNHFYLSILGLLLRTVNHRSKFYFNNLSAYIKTQKALEIFTSLFVLVKKLAATIFLCYKMIFGLLTKPATNDLITTHIVFHQKDTLGNKAHQQCNYTYCWA